ncbi:F-box domain/Galactose oxidase, central domain/Kelch motif containing protein [Novymonas esmeraldas]|uniref:F-box domain/Galactose oxidase, central domain/Kelch motif containing protein n=1 Tax=Novymonas esmeraldas TaxID=1808958 RepID=A0AAW0EL88_9TRYP
MSAASSLGLSAAVEQRVLAAASVLRLSPDAFIQRLLSAHYSTLGGLPRDLLRYTLTFLDYSTISAVLTRVCRLWHDCVHEDPLHYFARLRQVHGIHLLDPAHGLFYFPRALKRVVIDSKAPPPVASNTASSSSAGVSGTAALGPAHRGTGGTHRGGVPVVGSDTVAERRTTPQQQQQQSCATGAQVVPASSFLTVDIRTQNTKSLPWGYVRETVQWAIAEERLVYGEVRTPHLHRSEEPVWSQTATVAYGRRVYMFGGETYEGVVLDRAYEYDPVSKHWSVLPGLSERRAAASAVAYGGHIFVFGGYNAEGGVLDTYEVLHVETRTWVSQTQSPRQFYKGTSQQHWSTEMCGAPARAGDGHDGNATTAPDAAAAAAAGATWPFTTVPPPAWQGTGRRSAVSSSYRMPQKVCGMAVAVHGDVLLFAGGHQSRIAPEQTAVSYSAVTSATTTPMHAMPGGGGGGGGGVSSNVASSTASTSATNTPQRMPRADSLSMMGPATAESFVWVMCPRTGRWWTRGPRLPSPRAFGAMIVLELPVLGPCLCYFGGCAKADAPETAMLYIPLCAAAETRAFAMTAAEAATDSAAGDGGGDAELGNTAVSASRAAPSRRSGVAHREVRLSTSSATVEDVGGRTFLRTAQEATHFTPTTRTPPPHHRGGATPVHEGDGDVNRADGAAVLSRSFRNPDELPWQRYVRIPIGGAFTSVVVLGAAHSRSLVLTGFYPAPNIGFCKVNLLLPLDAFLPLLAALSPPLTAARADPDMCPQSGRVGDDDNDNTTTATPSPPSPPPPQQQQQQQLGGHRPSGVAAAASFVLPPTLQLDAHLNDEAAVAVNHWHQEREWSHHQRQEMREMVRAAAHAATMRHPRNPRTAGEEHKWSLAPVPEVRVASRGGPALARVSWKVQTLNAKVIVGIE